VEHETDPMKLRAMIRERREQSKKLKVVSGGDKEDRTLV